MASGASTLLPLVASLHSSHTPPVCPPAMRATATPACPAVMGPRRAPRSCDTFVAMPPATRGDYVVFGKNSDRPHDEVQEVVAFPSATHLPGATLQCTYITIPQVAATHAVVLSRPTWLWGAEMGANEHGLVVGNEAVWTVEEEEAANGLLGMDLVRLALERSASADEAVDTITSLLEEHGQGGACEEDGSWSYHNSFLLADARVAWVVETAGRRWAAEKVTNGVRNISNCLSIRTTMHRSCPGLADYARRRGHWDGRGQLDWARAFSEGHVPPPGEKSAGREHSGYALLRKAAGGVGIGPEEMMAILRDKGSGICMEGGFRTTGSQVSVIGKGAGSGVGEGPGSLLGSGPGSELGKNQAVHWFTATPDPGTSVYKRFQFGKDGLAACEKTTAARSSGRNPSHVLWDAHEAAYEGRGRRQLREDVEVVEKKGLEGRLSFGDAVQAEMEAYQVTTDKVRE